MIFLCGSLEPGKDGVGDYTRRLAQSMVTLGNQVQCIALNDKYVSLSACDAVSKCPLPPGATDFIRFSSHSPWQIRLQVLEEIINVIQPDWISIQYVPYAYSRRGLPFRFATGLRRFSARSNWHIMFHEIFIAPQGSLRQIIISFIQKQIIKFIVWLLKPKLIHTSNKHYQVLLNNLSVRASILSLFGNIPILSSGNHANARPGIWTFLIFGSLHPNIDLYSLFTLIEEARNLASIETCEFISVGRLSPESNKLLNKTFSISAKEKYPHFDFYCLGEQNLATISHLMQNASFGISMTPIEWVEKSGTVAAMIDHGLPVIVTSISSGTSIDTLHAYTINDHLLLANADLPFRLCVTKRFLPKDSSLEIAKLFQLSLINSLGSSHPRSFRNA